jgi:murein DD-endopeptidase MepM/ murein hydrolase activator NlpD
MGQLLDKVIEDGIRKKYIDVAEGEKIKKTIKAISSKHGIAEEWIVKMVLVEAEGFNAKRDSGTCVGVVQACRSVSSILSNGGIAEVGGFEGFKNAGPAKQLEIWDRTHLTYWLKQAKRNPQTQGELMLLNILPARYLDIAAGRLNRDSKMPTAQASFLYTDYNPSTGKRTGGGYWSANSATRGMDIKAQQVLGSSILGDLANSTVNAVTQFGTLATNPGQSVTNGLNSIGAGIKSALLTGQNCPPPAYTQQDRIIYPGCLSKGSNPIFGNSLGSGPSAPAINAIGTASNKPVPIQAAGNSEPYTGSLKPGGLICPVKGAKISSPYGWRIHPITRKRRFHNGIDFAVGTGTPVLAAADGVVKSSGWMGGYGNTIVLTHSQLGADTLYAHNSRLAVTKGQQVKQGQVICYVGSTGDSTGPHSHVEVLLSGGKSTDPAKYIKC